MMQTAARLAATALLALLAACGGSSVFDQDGGPPDALQGSWFGTIDSNFTSAGSLATFRIEINGNGNITDVMIGGTNPPLTGSPIGTADGLSQYGLSDGREMSIFLDSDGGRFGFFIDDDSVGVVERDATSLPMFMDDDIVGSFIGMEYELDSTYDVEAARDARATGMTAPNGFNTQLDVPPSCTTAGTPNSVDMSFGVFETGSYVDTTAPPNALCLGEGELKVYLSPDTELLVAVACEGAFGTAAIPEDCRFSFYEK